MYVRKLFFGVMRFSFMGNSTKIERKLFLCFAIRLNNNNFCFEWACCLTPPPRDLLAQKAGPYTERDFRFREKRWTEENCMNCTNWQYTGNAIWNLNYNLNKNYYYSSSCWSFSFFVLCHQQQYCIRRNKFCACGKEENFK